MRTHFGKPRNKYCLAHPNHISLQQRMQLQDHKWDNLRSKFNSAWTCTKTKDTTNSHALGSNFETDDILFEWVRRFDVSCERWCSGSRSIWVTGWMPRICSCQLYHQSINHGHTLYGRSGINNQIHFVNQVTKERITEIELRFGMINWSSQEPRWHKLVSLDFYQWQQSARMERWAGFTEILQIRSDEFVTKIPGKSHLINITNFGQ
jgi:hypothetical protein